MSAQFTPGKWQVSFDEFGSATVFAHRFDESDPDDESCHEDETIVESVDGFPDDVRDANARLIAAAPELYEALRALRSALSSGVEVTQKVIPQVDAALAKARGDA